MSVMTPGGMVSGWHRVCAQTDRHALYLVVECVCTHACVCVLTCACLYLAFIKVLLGKCELHPEHGAGKGRRLYPVGELLPREAWKSS